MGTHKHFGENSSDDEGEKNSNITTKQNPSSPRGITKQRKQGRTGKNKKSSKSIRGQIRGIERLLKHKGASMAPSARKAKEEQLKELLRLRDDHDRRELERSMAQKYRMVKFFEKRKLQRVLDTIIKKGDKPEDAEQKKQVKRDLLYIDQYPKDQKYVALFPKGGHTEESKRRVEQIRAKIEGKDSAERKNEMEENQDKVNQDEQNDDFFLDDDSD